MACTFPFKPPLDKGYSHVHQGSAGMDGDGARLVLFGVRTPCCVVRGTEEDKDPVFRVHAELQGSTDLGGAWTVLCFGIWTTVSIY